jgi:hypothetical protein
MYILCYDEHSIHNPHILLTLCVDYGMLIFRSLCPDYVPGLLLYVHNIPLQDGLCMNYGSIM